MKFEIGTELTVTRNFGITKGEKYRVTKVANGKVCLSGINEDGLAEIQFSESDCGRYFERTRRVWTDWKQNDITISYKTHCGDCALRECCDNSEINECSGIHESVEYRHNGKVVQVKMGNIRASASCDPNDKFDLEKGFRIACKRLSYKLARREMKRRVAEYIHNIVGEEV